MLSLKDFYRNIYLKTHTFYQGCACFIQINKGKGKKGERRGYKWKGRDGWRSVLVFRLPEHQGQQR